MVNAKHLATFIMGAAAGVALHKYLQTEEGEKAFNDLKAKANDLKGQAEDALEKAPEYFEKLKTEASATMKEQFPDIEKFLQDLINGNRPSATEVQ
jgi:gas vesicle protein